ncbi:MAG: hypothetical protein ABJL67_20000 [Sulfitobacter sp.]
MLETVTTDSEIALKRLTPAGVARTGSVGSAINLFIKRWFFA